jgi:hypothetical protein
MGDESLFQNVQMHMQTVTDLRKILRKKGGPKERERNLIKFATGKDLEIN